ncbi:MAG: hypothetical protein R3Y68_08745 [Rikenellaceae bacterium]
MGSSPATPLPSVVATIEQRVEQLINDHQRISQLNGELTRQLERAKCAERDSLQRVRVLEKELAMAIVGGTSAKGKAKAKAQINRLMREVDNCITLLSSQGVGSKEEQRGVVKDEVKGNEKSVIERGEEK